MEVVTDSFRIRLQWPLFSVRPFHASYLQAFIDTSSAIAGIIGLVLFFVLVTTCLRRRRERKFDSDVAEAAAAAAAATANPFFEDEEERGGAHWDPRRTSAQAGGYGKVSLSGSSHASPLIIFIRSEKTLTPMSLEGVSVVLLQVLLGITPTTINNVILKMPTA